MHIHDPWKHTDIHCIFATNTQQTLGEFFYLCLVLGPVTIDGPAGNLIFYLSTRLCALRLPYPRPLHPRHHSPSHLSLHSACIILYSLFFYLCYPSSAKYRQNYGLGNDIHDIAIFYLLQSFLLAHFSVRERGVWCLM